MSILTVWSLVCGNFCLISHFISLSQLTSWLRIFRRLLLRSVITDYWDPFIYTWFRIFWKNMPLSQVRGRKEGIWTMCYFKRPFVCSQIKMYLLRFCNVSSLKNNGNFKCIYSAYPNCTSNRFWVLKMIIYYYWVNLLFLIILMQNYTVTRLLEY